MLNAHQLNVFVTAAETLNFTQAASHLKMTQPSVSQHIQALEQHFGFDLFIRSGRTLELTDAGLALLPLARELTYLSTHIEETMASLKGNVFGHLFVGCSTTIGRYILPQLLARFHQIYPQVRATCHVASPPHALELLCSGKVHLAMTSFPEQCKDVEFRKFAVDEILLIAPLGHPWAECHEINPEDLYDTEFILPEEDSEAHIATLRALSRLGISIYQLKSLMTLGSPEAIALSVQEGLGAGFVSKVVVNRLVPAGVKPIQVKGLAIFHDVYIGRNTHRSPTSAQEAFWNFVHNKENAILNLVDQRKVVIP